MDETVASVERGVEPVTSFGPVYVVEPKSQHTHTAIFLHGRGSSGEEFAEELIASAPPGRGAPMDVLPGWRWVFPTSRDLWSTAFQEEMPAWFEAHSLTDVTDRQDLQTEGIGESVRYLGGILDEETERLDGRKEHLVLGGISQGSAIAIWTLLCSPKRDGRLGAFVGASAWLPFADNIKRLLDQGGDSGQTVGSESSAADEFVKRMIVNPEPILSTPVFLGHGIDDAYVDVSLGRQERDVLALIGFDVEWKKYSGAEQEGHWLKEPEEVDDIVHFLLSVASLSDVV